MSISYMAGEGGTSYEHWYSRREVKAWAGGHAAVQ